MKRAIIALLLICTAVFAQQKGTGTFTDPRDKKKYKTVKIGEQTWMAENLKYNAKGSTCPGEDDNNDESNKSILCDKNGTLSQCINIECTEYQEYRTQEGYEDVCVKYKSLTAKQIQDKKKAKDKEIQANCAKEGRLYSNLPDNNVCPTGWHLPNSQEWGILRDIGSSTDGYAFRDEYGFENVSRFRVVPTGFVRCIEGKSPEEKEAEEKAAIEKAAGKQFNPKIKYGSITDARDNITYKTVKIGEQTWMAENLNYNAKGSKCYNDKEHYCKRDGRLYDLAGAKTSCPAGWHLATDGEWTILENAVGGKETAGTKLKATSGWLDSTAKKATNGTDDFGFSALPAGSASNYGKNFNRGGSSGLWWTASGEINRTISDAESKSGTANKSILFSVRCVEGEPPKEEAPAATPAKATAPANNPAKTMYCVSYVTGKPVSCMEVKDTQDGKKFCDAQNKSMKMMLGEAKLTETKPNINCGK